MIAKIIKVSKKSETRNTKLICKNLYSFPNSYTMYAPTAPHVAPRLRQNIVVQGPSYRELGGVPGYCSILILDNTLDSHLTFPISPISCVRMPKNGKNGKLPPIPSSVVLGCPCRRIPVAGGGLEPNSTTALSPITKRLPLRQPLCFHKL